MYRTAAIRAVPRAVAPRTLSRTAVRFASSSADVNANKATWKGLVLRWGAAVGALYWYNTSPVFADDPNPTKTVPPPPQFSDDEAPTVQAVIVQKRKQAEARGLAKQKAEDKENKNRPTDSSSTDGGEEGTAELEEEAGQQAAFNPETGEINWDCPCLGGMADGPCGEEFKAAFSCFVYSEEEPKGIGCIEKFQGMQDCFRKYPEIYGDELADDEEEDGDAPQSQGSGEKEGEEADEEAGKPVARPVKETAGAPGKDEASAPPPQPPPPPPPKEGAPTNKQLEERRPMYEKDGQEAEKVLPKKPQVPKDPMRDAT